MAARSSNKQVLRWDQGAQAWKQQTPAKAPSRPRRRVATGRVLARQFQAAQTDRLTASWTTVPIPADDVIRKHQRVLVARSREQFQNNDYAKAYGRKLRTNVIGHRGIQLQAQARDPNGSLDTRANQAIEAGWTQWGKRQHCDITGQRSWREIQNACVTSAAEDGEYFVRIITGREAGPWGFALQLIDAQRCPVDYDLDNLPGGEFIRHGIRFSRYGRPVAYLFGTVDPSEADYHYGGRHFVEVPAAEVIHGFAPEMIGQKRGLPWMATALWRMNMQKGYTDAALVNARASAAKGGWLEWDENTGPQPDDPGSAEDHEEIYMEGDPGVWQELPPGLRAKDNNLSFPAQEFAVFDKQMLRGMAAGVGADYNSLAQDRENVNFSSIRQGALDERDFWKCLQEWVIETLCEPVFEAWLPRQLLAGNLTVAGSPLPAAKRGKFMAHIWQPRRWAWVDPDKDTKSAERQKNNLLTAPSQIIREQGSDPDTVWRNFAEDIKSMRAAGIPNEFINAAIFGSTEPSGGPSDPGPGESDDGQA